MFTNRLSKPLLKLAAVASLTMTLAACQTSGPAVRPSLPVPPMSFGQPVKAPALVKGESAKAALAETRGALARADARLANDAAYYGDVRSNFSK